MGRRQAAASRAAARAPTAAAAAASTKSRAPAKSKCFTRSPEEQTEASFSDLAIDAAGNLYGTASEGGFFGGKCAPIQVGCGVIFKISPKGEYKVLHAFRWVDGASPYAGVTLDAQGNLYGTTGFGGSSGWGTVYKFDASSRKVTVLYNFTKGVDGAIPHAAVLLDAQGNIYGTTQYGGFSGNRICDNGCGLVFKVSPGGEETVLHAFTSVPDGRSRFPRSFSTRTASFTAPPKKAENRGPGGYSKSTWPARVTSGCTTSQATVTAPNRPRVWLWTAPATSTGSGKAAATAR